LSLVQLIRMNTAGIYIRTQPEVKAKAQKIAKRLGLSLSELVNIWLIQFVKTRRVDFNAETQYSSVKSDSSTHSARSE